MKNISMTVSKTIKVTADKAWDALTKPELVKQYFFGTNLVTSWRVGTPVLFKGEWEGKPYEDKGTVLEFIAGKKLSYNYWSNFSGTADVPENYQIITYEVKPEGDFAEVSISQSNIESEEKKKHSEQNWGMVLDAMAKLIEN